MPPKILCRCIHCGPKGVFFTLTLFSIHQTRLRQEAEQAQLFNTPPTTNLSPPSTTTLGDLADELTTLTLVDPPSSATTMSHNRLWTSREEYQEAVGLPSQLRGELSLGVMNESLARILSTSRNNSVSASLSAPSSSEPTNQNPPTSPTRTPAEKLNRQQRQKSTFLTNIKNRANAALATLSSNTGDAAPDYVKLDAEYKQLDAAFSKIKQQEYLADDWTKAQDVLSKLRDTLQMTGQSDLQEKPHPFDSDHHFSLPINEFQPVAQCAIFLGVVAAVIMGVSHRAGDFILSTISLILRIVFVDFGMGGTREAHGVIKDIPTTVKTALATFDVDHKVVVYAVCPACHCTYPPIYQPGSRTPTYPSHCSYMKLPKNDKSTNGPMPCREPLLAKQEGKSHPLKTFHYYSFHDYLASLLSRPEIEEAMDKSSADLLRSLDVDGVDGPPIVHSPFDATFLRSFPGPEHDKLFVQSNGSEGRYFFIFHVDFFNPLGLKTRGPTLSYGIISMACLNLPIEIRYKPENMYLAGIVPGPIEPHEDMLNHYILPPINDLATSWHRGVQYSKTAHYPEGRLTRSAAAAVVCDLLAARKVSQLPAHNSHHYCSVCKCYHVDTRRRCDITKWEPHDNQERRHWAEQYRDAPNRLARHHIFENHGVRWSPLWTLPYWDPGVQLVVDPMHCVLEGLVQFQVRQVLHLNKTSASKSAEDLIPKNAVAFVWDFTPVTRDAIGWSKNARRDVGRVHKLLCAPIAEADSCASLLFAPLVKKLGTMSAIALHHVYCDVVLNQQVPFQKPNKLLRREYAEKLVTWRESQPHRDSSLNMKYATPELIAFIQRVIKDISTPTWLGYVPHRFGEAAAGTIKASEWRLLASVHLPIALVLSWQKSAISSLPLPEQAHLQSVLQHTMNLFSATRLACLRTTSAKRITAYENNMVQYVHDLRVLHPNSGMRTNIHMALHVGGFLRQFGPVHSWWTFPFERLIGILQRLPTNNKTGEAEATMLHAHLRSATLRHWVSRRDCPLPIQELKNLFERAYGTTSDINNEGLRTHANTTNEYHMEQKIPPCLKGLVPANSQFHARFKYNGIHYSKAETHLGNSLVEYYPDGNTSTAPAPASIQWIYTSNEDVYFVVQGQEHAPSTVEDPFAIYPYFPAKIHGTRLKDQLTFIHADWVFSHYARYVIDNNICVVLSLSHW